MKYTNSSLIDCVVKSPNHSGMRTHEIDRITPHCVVGEYTATRIGECFPKGRDASCNYGIGLDGKVCLIVDEANRSWCSSSDQNDQRAVTIECASDTVHPYKMKAEVYDKLVELCADICRRNDKTELLWIGDKDRTLNYKPKENEMVLTVHRWFANKSCPGDWLYSRLGNLAEQVTSILNGTSIHIEKVTENPSATKSIEEIAKEVIKGSWGNGSERKKRLEAAGYDALSVQKEVNRIMGRSKG